VAPRGRRSQGQLSVPVGRGADVEYIDIGQQRREVRVDLGAVLAGQARGLGLALGQEARRRGPRRSPSGRVRRAHKAHSGDTHSHRDAPNYEL